MAIPSFVDSVTLTVIAAKTVLTHLGKKFLEGVGADGAFGLARRLVVRLGNIAQLPFLRPVFG